jgi:hypothetical protein
MTWARSHLSDLIRSRKATRAVDSTSLAVSSPLTRCRHGASSRTSGRLLDEADASQDADNVKLECGPERDDGNALDLH